MKRMTKRMIKGIMIIFFSVYLNAKDGTGVSQSSVTIVDIDISTDVPVYEYVPKVIIQGKWGDKPGEFGVWDEMSEGDMTIYRPTSMAVDSKGNIYILDVVNERIQKFDSEGKYLLSIPVESFSGRRYEAETIQMVDKNNPDILVEPDNPNRIDVKKKFIKVEPDYKAIGINIVIDSKDTLYYYLERRDYEIYEVSNRDERYSELTREHSYALWRDTYTVIYKLKGKRGEVWEYKEDKLVRKWEVPGDLKGGLSFYDNSLWITENPMECINANFGEDYNVFEGKFYERKKINEKIDKSKNIKGIERTYLDKNMIEIKTSLGKKIQIKSSKGNISFIDDKTSSENRISNKIKIEGDLFGLVVEENGKIYENYYDLSGKLIKRHLRPDLNIFGCKDRKGRMFLFNYLFEREVNEFKVIMYSWEKRNGK